MIERYQVKEIADIWTDEEKFNQYLNVELALIEALDPEYGTKKAVNKIKSQVKVNPQRILEIEKIVKHDVIAFCSSITEQLTEEESKFFHWGVTSSDIIDTAHSLLIKKSLEIILGDFKKCLTELKKAATEMKLVPCMGRSHGINAEPMSFGVKLLNHYCELRRRFNELQEFQNSDLTAQFSGAVGNYTILSPDQENSAAKKLGLKVEPVSSQIIARDRISKMMGIIANFSVGLERLCIEIRHLHHSNIGEIAEGFGTGQKGSSTMPHKKNPISGENLSGIARMLRTYYQASLDNNLLWHERDISHSSAERIFLPDALGLMSYSLRRLSSTIKNLVYFPEKMLQNIPKSNYFFSSFFLHQLLLKTDMRREDIYKKVQEISFKCIDENLDMITLFKEEFSDVAKEINLSVPRQQLINERYLSSVDQIFDRVEGEYPPI
jgi:adenylosuccinate lyase